ncbi:MAG: UDP-N-acetylmuramate:L-alanyl-gamma-D-glutamyl-meso-diaminopimelate ligase [Gammaproteobacteria bacterium]|nr:MAG: UDP-N-acetylmuramate:L-alanyl-gamma-D-glutamyl-meso-diaminopimelate ligase [Gammaproteobacteria bacterium]
MGGIALLARQLGIEVSGCDANLYPPMSTQLMNEGITVMEGYQAAHLDPPPDLVVVGNVMSRGNPMVETMLEQGLAYTSGPAFLSEHILPGRWVMAVAGTHGKTTTASLLAWILEYAGMSPGFLIGGIPENFSLSARLGESSFFVVEADEYDTAFFDKRSKFVHYRPRTLIINNLEYDHADIFDDLDDIKRQFHHLLRMVPGNGLIIAPSADDNIKDVLQQGCWTPLETFDADSHAGSSGADSLWTVRQVADDLHAFNVFCDDIDQGRVNWNIYGRHNINNALAAIAAARHAGVPVPHAIDALASFKSVKRRMELKAEVHGITIYDDFAHHPTAIALTLEGVRKRMNSSDNGRLIAVIEPRSNSMRMGVHQQILANSVALADQVYFFNPGDLDWDLGGIVKEIGEHAVVDSNVDALVEKIRDFSRRGDQIVIMSNGAFGGIHQKLEQAVAAMPV